MVKLVIAEDDAVTRRKLEFCFRQSDYELLAVSDGPSALAALQNRETPTVAILDVMMPGMTGIDVCQKVRSARYVVPPYLILLTVNGRVDNVVVGLESGADDYMTKPFDMREIQARVRVGVRMLELQRSLVLRVKELEDALSRLKQLQGLLRLDVHTYQFGPFRLEAGERRLLRGGKPVQLTSRIFDLLLLLVQNSGHLVAKEEIMREVWRGNVVEENNLTVSISVLRKALEEVQGQREYIETVPKRGYRFVAPVTETVAEGG